jgi:hypothetical protein
MKSLNLTPSENRSSSRKGINSTASLGRTPDDPEYHESATDDGKWDEQEGPKHPAKRWE